MVSLTSLFVFEGVYFDFVEFQRVNFSNAQCQGAYFWIVQCLEVDFSNAQCQGVDFGGEQYQGANFKGAQCQGANFKDVQFNKQIKLQSGGEINKEAIKAIEDAQLYLDNYWYEKMQQIIEENEGKDPEFRIYGS